MLLVALLRLNYLTIQILYFVSRGLLNLPRSREMLWFVWSVQVP